MWLASSMRARTFLYWPKAVTTGSISAAALASRAYSARPAGALAASARRVGELLVAALDLPELIEHGPRSGPGSSAGPAPRRGRRLALPVGVLLLEALDAPGRVHQLLLAGEERMALRADLHPDVRAGGAGVDDLAAGARDQWSRRTRDECRPSRKVLPTQAEMRAHSAYHMGPRPSKARGPPPTSRRDSGRRPGRSRARRPEPTTTRRASAERLHRGQELLV